MSYEFTVKYVTEPFYKFWHLIPDKNYKLLYTVGDKDLLINFIDNNYKKGENQIFILGGDYEDELNIDDKMDAIFFRQSFLKSKKKQNEMLIPSSYGCIAGDINMVPCEISDKPKISFCGSKNSHPCREPLFNILENSNDIDCNFIYITTPCCGLVDPEIDKKSKTFTDNLETSEFSFCPRGNGNFSIRFYEALMSGRIPILLETDNELPFEKYIDWNKICVISKNKDELIDDILFFYKNNDLIEIQQKCKQIFKEYFIDKFDILLMTNVMHYISSINNNIVLIPKNFPELSNIFHVNERSYPNFNQIEIYELDLTKKFFIARGSGQESWLSYTLHCLNQTDFAESVINGSNTFFIEGCGIYLKNMDSAKKYAEGHINAFKKVHLYGAIDKINHHYQLKFTEMIANEKIDITTDIGLLFYPEFYYSNPNYMDILKKIYNNKKILVISSHKDSIEHQIPKLKYINPFLETCTFEVIRPPQTSCGNHNNTDWSEHLDTFFSQLQLVNDFDIALICSGGYSIFIAEYIYEKMNRSVIYPGGSLQLWFGIMGNRWKAWWNYYYYPDSKDYWIDPLDSDKPKNNHLVDGNGAYW
jgi:hypothetical protein